MKKALVFFAALLLSATLSAQQAYTIETLPRPDRQGGGMRVSDPDGLLRSADVSTLNELALSLEAKSTAQLAIVIVQSIGQENPKDFATRLFNHWGIGQADVDNGLLIFSVIDQRRTEFETGYGLEGVLPDVLCYRIGMQELVPYFKQDQYGPGLIAAVDRIKALLEDPEALAEIRSSEQGDSRSDPLIGLLGIYLLINLLFHLFLAGWLLYASYNHEDLYDRYVTVRKVYQGFLIILFPLPYGLIYPLLGGWLRRLRNHPRYSKKTGEIMHKLSEEEDDKFLELGEVVEERINSVDYDVWVTEDEADVLILRYAKRWSRYSACPKCSYRAFHQSNTRVLRHASYSSSGQKEIMHSCKNCNYSKRTLVTIPRKQRSSGGGGFSGGGGGGGFGGGSSGGGGGGVSW